MATVTAQGTGYNWSSTTPDQPWPSGTLPANGDTVDLNGHVVVWDAGITTIPASGKLAAITSPLKAGQITLDLSNVAFSGGAALNVDSITPGTITAAFILVSGDTSNTLTVSASGGATTFVGSAASNGRTISNTGTGSIITIGNATGGSNSSISRFCLHNGSTGAWTHTGNLTGGASPAFGNSSTGTVSLSNCLLTGGSGVSGVAFLNLVAGSVTLENTGTGCNMVNSANAMAWQGTPPTWNMQTGAYCKWGSVYLGQPPATNTVLNAASGGAQFQSGGSLVDGTASLANTQYVLDTCPDYGVGGTGGAKTATIPAGLNVQAGAAAFGINGTSETPSYPTTASTQASQEAADAALVDAVKAGILSTTTVLGVTGTFDALVWEAARNSDPGEANVKDGTAYEILGVAKEGTMPEGGGGAVIGSSIVIGALA